MSEMIYDVIVVGCAPAGLTAAIYTSRERLSTLILEKGICGGSVASTDLIENYPGFPQGINGMELMAKFKEQAQRFGANIAEANQAMEIMPQGDTIKVRTEDNNYIARAIIIASGSVFKRLNVSGEKEYKGRGVSYCATCDGPLFRNKDIAVIGCGDSGLQEGSVLLKYVKSVTFVGSKPKVKGSAVVYEALQKQEKVRFLLNQELISVNGDVFVTSITLKNRETNQEKQIPVSGVFIYVGWLPNTKFLEGIVEKDEKGYIITNEKMQSSVPGIYAVGDVRSKEVRQITVACAEGTIAAMAVRDYINELIVK